MIVFDIGPVQLAVKCKLKPRIPVIQVRNGNKEISNELPEATNFMLRVGKCKPFDDPVAVYYQANFEGIEYPVGGVMVRPRERAMRNMDDTEWIARRQLQGDVLGWLNGDRKPPELVEKFSPNMGWFVLIEQDLERAVLP